MRLPLAILLALSLAATAGATAFDWPNTGSFGRQRRHASAPAFLFTAPAAGAYASITPTYGGTIACTRNSTATYQPTATTLATAASGTCRVDYRGLEIEKGATNLVSAPLDFSSASWTKQHSPTIAVNQCAFPDSTTSMDKITGTDNVSVVLQSKSSPGTGAFTLSGWASTSSTGPGLDLERSGGSSFSTCICSVEAPYGCSTPGSTITDCALQVSGPVDSTPARISITADSATALTTLFAIAGPGLYNNASNNGAHACWGGMQLETGTFATSYIPDGTRDPDVIDLGSIALGHHPSFSGTANLKIIPASGSAIIEDFSDGTNAWALAINSSGNAVCSYGANSDTSTSHVSPHHASLVQCSYDGAAIHTCIDGACHQTSASFTPVSSFTHTYIGSDGSANYLNGFLSTLCAGSAGRCPAGEAPSGGSVATSGLVYWFDAENIDGLDNATAINGEAMGQWTNLGSGSDGISDAGSQPLYLANSLNGAHDSVNFAGDTQTFDLGATSKSDAAFIHNDGVFDVFVVAESDRFRGGDPLIDDGTAKSGATGASLTTDSSGHLVFTIHTAGATTTIATSDWKMPLFQWTTIEAVGDGSLVGLSSDLEHYHYTQFGTLPAGDSTTDLFVGGVGGGTVFGWNGGIQEVLIYNRKLDDAERANLKTWLRARSGL